jgi:hypothetical protein
VSGDVLYEALLKPRTELPRHYGAGTQTNAVRCSFIEVVAKSPSRRIELASLGLDGGCAPAFAPDSDSN